MQQPTFSFCNFLHFYYAINIGRQNRFGRYSEKMEDSNQISFLEVDGTIVFFNEAEAVCDLSATEPEDLELKTPKHPKRK